MKRFPFNCILALGLLGLAPLGKAAKIDFTSFEGTYKSRCLLIYGDTVIQSPDLKIEVAVPENGRQAKFRIVGFADASAMGAVSSIALLGHFSLTSTRKVTADNALLAFFVRLPARSHFKGNTRRMTFPLFSEIPGLGAFAMTYVLRHHGKTIFISGHGISANGPVTVQYTARRTGKIVSDEN